jgi:chemotaxis protein CheY-P-specific phosphatase CheC
MKAQERFDKILLAGTSRIPDEVSALIGKSFKLGEPRTGPVDKETLFADLGGKQVLAHIQIEGDIQGKGCLLIGIKDAIRIGGTLIMLPEAELETVVADQQYSEELQDSYGEVANIICGAATVSFEEQSPKTVRLVRTDQEIILPAKVDIESDQPIADIPYYHLAVPMTMEDKEMGTLYMVLPAQPFGLAEAKPKVQPVSTPKAEPKARQAAGDDGDQPVGVIERESFEGGSGEAIGVLERPEGSDSAVDDQSVPGAPRKRDIGKQRKLIDGLLKNCWAKMSDEISALLGGTLKVTPIENRAVTKEEFLDQAGVKQIMTRMELRGDAQGEAFLFVDLKSAVYLGGSLIMLPESELEETVRDESFGEDARDAYGEVTNIIAGIFTAVFEEQYRDKIGFVKVAVEPVTPAKVDPETDEVLASQGYYLALGQMKFNNRDLGRAQVLVPAEAFDLEQLLLAGATESEVAQAIRPKAGNSVDKAGSGGREPARLPDEATDSPDVLIVTDDDPEGSHLARMLEEAGYTSRILHFKDPVNSLLTPRIEMVFLVMKDVSEQGFGVAIKISSSGFHVPLVAAGPAWTRTTVLKAVKYGVCDILITPASAEDVREKLADNLVKKAA